MKAKLEKDIEDFRAQRAEFLFKVQAGLKQTYVIELEGSTADEKFPDAFNMILFRLGLSKIPVWWLEIRDVFVSAYSPDIFDVFYDNRYMGRLSNLIGHKVYFPLQGPDKLLLKANGEYKEDISVKLDLEVVRCP